MFFFIFSFFRLLKIGITVILSFAICWLPFLSTTESALQVLNRLFPFARGLYEVTMLQRLDIQYLKNKYVIIHVYRMFHLKVVNSNFLKTSYACKSNITFHRTVNSRKLGTLIFHEPWIQNNTDMFVCMHFSISSLG